MTRPHALAAILFATALAGCVQDSGSVQASESPVASASPAPSLSPAASGSPAATTASTAPPHHTSEPAPAPAPNTPPTANLTSDIVNGSVPLNVTFSIRGADADGDNLSWTLDADGDGAADANGTDLPASFAFSDTEAGNYTALFNVTDGEAFAETNLTIRAELPPPAGPLICDRTPTLAVGPVYRFDGDGSIWIFLEDNGIAGLQVGNTHPLGDLYNNPGWVDFENGDLLLF